MKLNFIEDQKGSGKGWVQVFPRGKHYINKYDFILDCNDNFFASIKEWWEKSTFKKPFIDKGHEFNEKYGEFTDMRITDKGLELFMVLNEEGKELVRSGKYEYLSPTFNNAADSTGKQFQNVIFSVSLVNAPALMVLDKIKNQIELSIKNGDEGSKKNKGGFKMDLKEILAGKLNLSLNADEMSILAKIEDLINSAKSLDDLKANVEELKGSLTTAEGKLSILEKENSALKADNQKHLDAYNKAQAEALEAEAKAVVDEAIKLGQYHPSLKDMKVDQYKSNKDMIVKELSIIPKTKQDGKKTSSGAESLSFDISDEEKEILLSVGYDLTKPEDQELAKKFIEESRKREA